MQPTSPGILVAGALALGGMLGMGATPASAQSVAGQAVPNRGVDPPTASLPNGTNGGAYPTANSDMTTSSYPANAGPSSSSSSTPNGGGPYPPPSSPSNVRAKANPPRATHLGPSARPNGPGGASARPAAPPYTVSPTPPKKPSALKRFFAFITGKDPNDESETKPIHVDQRIERNDLGLD
ncbi:MAG: hypothetical protein JO252_27050 [Planctomycetaceae bacterium]|nr:hypothetical protein [Planctomycetaceae bacterium]